MLTKKKIIIAVIALSATLFAAKPTDKYFEIARNLEIFTTLFQEVNRYYVDDVSPTNMINSGISSMLNTLDPYTNYIPEDRIEDYRTMTTGEYGGIGASVGKLGEEIMVMMVFEGFAAQKGGVHIGDKIIKINDVNVSGKEYSDISKLLKGQVGSDINIVVERFGNEKSITFNLKREKIHIKNVPYQGMVTEDIGLIQLTDFTRNASKEVKNALNNLKGKGAKKLILDLRGNPGGLLDEAINISNIFIPRGSEIVSTKGKNKDWNKQYKTLNVATDLKIPVAVLINGFSASASEIVSGVIQDFDRGVLIGKRSFGKGLVQTTRPLSYNSRLKVTVAKYYIPSGRCIQEVDYSNRDKHGNAIKFASEDREAFKTKNGRKVYDGGGVSPEIVTDKIKFAAITISLLNKGHIFHYATEYRTNKESIDQATKFSLSNSEYQRFVDWLNGKDYEYQTKVEKMLESLVKNAKDDKNYDEIKLQIDALEKKVHHNKESDLLTFKDEIKELLEREIVARYYSKKGFFEATFNDDQDIIEAIKILNDTNKYNELLSIKN